MSEDVPVCEEENKYRYEVRKARTFVHLLRLLKRGLPAFNTTCTHAHSLELTDH